MKVANLSICLAMIPAIAAAQGHCAVPSVGELGFQLPAVVNPLRALGPVSAVSTKGTLNGSGTTPLSSPSIPDIPALRLLRERGNVIDSLGSLHGLSTFVAHSPGHFMVFDVTPDQKAILAGLEMQVPLDKLLALSKERIKELPHAHGLRAFFLQTGERFQVFYATPDEQRVVPGLMWDETGKNVTRQQVANIPGMKPQVQINTPSGSPTAEVGTAGRTSLDAIKVSYAGAYGRSGAPHAWMFVDPQCSFSVRALQALEPSIDSGAIQLSVVPLSILDAEDHGVSTRHAIAMVKEQPDTMVRAWQRNTLDSDQSAVSDDDAEARLQYNMQAAKLISLAGTPTFVWQNHDGSMGRLDGVPRDVAAMIKSIGSWKP
jgi:thiol:disulfide interchange protein DsbG